MSRIYVFNTRISLVSATRLAGEGRIQQILGLEKIPAAMKPLLRQPVVPSEILNPLEMHKKRVRDYLLKHATRDEFFGWIIDPDRKDDILARVEEIKAEFYQSKEDMLSGYPSACEKHLQDLRESCEKEGAINCAPFIDAVRAAQPEKSYLDQQIQFGYLRPRLIELEPDEVDIVREGVYAQVLHEIASRAKGALSFKMTTAKIRVAEEIQAKLSGLAYIESRLWRIADEIGQVLEKIPKGIRNEDYDPIQNFALSGVFSVLADEDGLARVVASGDGLFPTACIDLPPASMTLFEEPVEPIVQPAINEEPSNEKEEMQALAVEAEEQPESAFYGW